MASTVLKCTNCNIVINEVLAFVQNKCDVMDEVSLASLCLSSFAEEDIVVAKNLLLESISCRKPTRIGSGKSQRNMDDIITVIKETDPEKVPIFVAKELQKLPPVTFDHIDVTRLLKDIIILQKELRYIQENFLFKPEPETQYATTAEVQQLRFEIEKLKRASPQQARETEPYVNTRRGAFCLQDSFNYNSGPMGLITGFDAEQPTTTQGEAEKVIMSPSHATDTARKSSNPVSLSPPQIMRPSYAEATIPITASAKPAQPTSVESVQAVAVPPPLDTTTASRKIEVRRPRSSNNTYADELSKNVEKPIALQTPAQSEEDWIEVRKRKKQRFQGRKGTALVDINSKFKAADVKIPLFIYNVSPETSAKDVEEYIMNKTNIDVRPEKMIMKNAKGYNSYKFYIPKHKLSLFDDETLWPDGVYFRRYIIFKERKSNQGADNFSQSSK